MHYRNSLSALLGFPHKRITIGGSCAVAVPDKLDMKIQFKHSNDPKAGGGKRGNKSKNLYHLVGYCSDKRWCCLLPSPGYNKRERRKSSFHRNTRQNKMPEEVNIIDNQILCRIHVLGRESIMSKGEDLLPVLNSAVLS